MTFATPRRFFNARFATALVALGGFVVSAGSFGCDAKGTTSSSSSSTGSSSTSTGMGGNGGAPAFTICAKQHDEGGVIVCDEAFPTAPAVHLPDATATTDVMAISACARFVDRAGIFHEAVDGLAICDDPMTFELNAEAFGHAFALYETTIDPTGKISAFKRFAVVDEGVVLARLSGVHAEGLISAKDAQGKLELDPTLPVRLTFGAPKPREKNSDGFTVFEVDATIDNLTDGAVGADGSCIAPLSASASNPFAGASTVHIAFYRVPSMHAPGDDEGVVDFYVDEVSNGSGMAASWFFPLADLIATSGIPAPAQYDSVGHGTPGYIPSLNLKLVTAGGGACN